MTEKQKWPNKYHNLGDKIFGGSNMSYYDGFNSAIDQCNACVQGITEEEIVNAMPTEGTISVTRHNIAAAIVKHIKSRLTGKE